MAESFFLIPCEARLEAARNMSSVNFGSRGAGHKPHEIITSLWDCEEAGHIPEGSAEGVREHYVQQGLIKP